MQGRSPLLDPRLDPRLAREVQVVHAAYRSAGVTRAELAELTGLSATGVVRLVGDLLERGLLIAGSKADRGSRGRPSDLLRIHPEAGYVVGIEFGRAHLATVTVDAAGTLRHRALHAAAAPAFVAEPATAAELARIARGEAAAAGIDWSAVSAVGLALHDIVNARGEWLTHEQLDGPALPIRAEMERRLGRLVVAEDVSRAFAPAEHRYGSGRDAPDMIYLFVGSHGVGSGTFVNDALLRSSSGVCGEIGHLPVVPDGERCPCGNRGCLETVATHEAVASRFAELARRGAATSLPLGPAATFAATFGPPAAVANTYRGGLTAAIHRLLPVDEHGNFVRPAGGAQP